MHSLTFRRIVRAATPVVFAVFLLAAGPRVRIPSGGPSRASTPRPRMPDVDAPRSPRARLPVGVFPAGGMPDADLPPPPPKPRGLLGRLPEHAPHVHGADEARDTDVWPIHETEKGGLEASAEAERRKLESWTHISTSGDQLVVRWNKLPVKLGDRTGVFQTHGVMREGAAVGLEGSRDVATTVLEVVQTLREETEDQTNPMLQYRPIAVDLSAHHLIIDAAAARDPRGLALPPHQSVSIHVEGRGFLRARPYPGPEGRTHFDVELAPHVTVPVHATDVMRDFDQLRALPLRPDQVRATTLISDTATRDALKKSLGRAYRPVEFPSTAGLRKVMRESKGRLLVVVAHREGTDLVWRDAGGRALARFPIQDVLTMAAETDTSLFLVACELATVSGGGPLKELNSLDVVQHLNRARSARTHREFVTSFASETIPLQLDSSVIIGAHRVHAASLRRDTRTGLAATSAGALTGVAVYLVMQALGTSGEEEEDEARAQR